MRNFASPPPPSRFELRRLAIASFSPLCVILALMAPSRPMAAWAAEEAEKPAEKPTASVPENPLAVDEHKDLAYYDGADAHATKHRLDLFLPRNASDYPTVVFIHGGAWMAGDKSNFGIYAAIGHMLAEHGLGCAVVNYRLSPSVQHPEHIRDVARAFAWVRANIARYGGDRERLFVAGHSAGGHLAALLATDESYLTEQGLGLADIKAVVAISGVYIVPGTMFKSVFGDDAALHRQASPIEHVSERSPPMLLIHADHDFPFAEDMALDFAKALRDKHVTVETLPVENRNHIDVMWRATKPDDPVAAALMAWVRKWSRPGGGEG